MTCGAPASWRLPASIRIQYAVAALLAPLGSVCQVGKLENQRLLLVVPGPAHAAKLRQLAPRIAQSLADQGWNLNEIAVKVQAGLQARRPSTEAAERSATPGRYRPGRVRDLAPNLRPGPLADAVAKLLKHHKE